MTGLVILGILAVIFMPFTIVWAMNFLFALGIAYSFKAWLAVIILFGTLNGGIIKFRSLK